MVCRLIEGWESSTTPSHYLGKWTAFTNTPTISSAAGRNGQGIRFASANNTASRTLDAQATWIVGFAFRTSSLATGANVQVCAFLDGAVVHCGLAFEQTSGTLYAWRGTTATSLGSASAALVANTWAYVEVKATIHDTAGVFVVRVNGATVLNLSSQDTRNAGNASANVVRLGPAASLAFSFDYDDVYVFDATGTVNADFAGDCKVEQVLPGGAGASSAWTPSAGSNWQCVDEAPPTGDTDYVSSATAGQTDTYACGDLGVTGAVAAVQATAYARKDDAGTRTLALVARPGGTDRVGATQALSTTYAMYPQVWDTNPDTAAAWTVSELNASQFGQTLVA